jgi:hypothetical protein
MAANETYDTAHVVKLSPTSSSAYEDLGITRKHFTMIADTDCYVNFNKPVTTTGRMYIKANLVYEFCVDADKLAYLGTSGNLYVTAAR